jgi:hypothetical protein
MTGFRSERKRPLGLCSARPRQPLPLYVDIVLLDRCPRHAVSNFFPPCRINRAIIPPRTVEGPEIDCLGVRRQVRAHRWREVLDHDIGHAGHHWLSQIVNFRGQNEALELGEYSGRFRVATPSPRTPRYRTHFDPGTLGLERGTVNDAKQSRFVSSARYRRLPGAADDKSFAVSWPRRHRHADGR